MKERLLLVDYQNVFYRSAAVNKELSHDGQPTGGLYGFAVQLASVINRTRPTMVAVCLDRKPYLRKRLYPAYKAGRRKRDAAEDDATLLERKRILDQNSAMCKEFIRCLRIPMIGCKGMEADDVIAELIRKYHDRFNEIAILSNDSDLYQLLDWPNVYMHIRPQVPRFDIESFREKYPKLMRASEWREVRALTGDHNNIRGIPGIGDVRAIRLVTELSYRERHSDLLEQYDKMIRLNRRLCRLPLEEYNSEEMLDKVKLPDKQFIGRRSGEAAAMRLLASHGIQYTGAMHSAFSRLYE